MAKFILATKEYMTQFFTEDGRAVPATVLSAEPVMVTQVKTPATDGYSAVQVGSGERKQTTKPLRGHLKDLKPFRYLKEFRGSADAEYKRGDMRDVSQFASGETVSVRGTSKGKGFQGVVKRHGFHGGPRTHGQRHSERAPGSIGATGPQRVHKGTKMAGRMGGDTVTVKNLHVLAVDKDKNQMLVSGAVPGRKGTLLEIRSQA